MHDTGRVQTCHPTKHLEKAIPNPKDLCLRKWTNRLAVRRRRLRRPYNGFFVAGVMDTGVTTPTGNDLLERSLHAGLDEIITAVDAARVEDRHDVGIIDFLDRAHTPVKPQHGGGVRAKRGVNALDRNRNSGCERATERRRVRSQHERPIHDDETSLADLFAQPIWTERFFLENHSPIVSEQRAPLARSSECTQSGIDP